MLQSEAGYIDARPHQPELTKPLAPHGRTIHLGHFRQINPLPTLSACPLRSDRVRTFAPQQFDAVRHKGTRALQQTQS